VTGLPGVGKTTLIRALAKRLVPYHPIGFYTEEIRDARGNREGFQLVTMDGRRLILAHVDHSGPARVSRYGVDIDGFERLLLDLDLPHGQSNLFVIDEIGKMECLSQRFQHDITGLLSQSKTLVATIALKGNGFIKQVRDRQDCRLVTVTRENRDRLIDDLATELQRRLRERDD
jgi:nucleoside-triphosphatase